MSSNKQPKYVFVMEQIRKYIESGQLKEHDQMPSEHTLTKDFSVSRHTVRKAISHLVNDGVLYSIQGKGTFVADYSSSLSTNSKQVVGVMTTYIKDYIFPEIIEGIDEVLLEEGYSILLGNTYNQVEKERQCLTNMMNNGINALIVEPTQSALPNPNIDLYQKLRDSGIPILFLHGYYGNLDVNALLTNDEEGGYIATKHLIKLGHQHIGGIFKSDDLQGHLRYQGYIKAHREFNLPINQKGIIWYSTEDTKNLFSLGDPRNSTLQRLNNCTGIVCYNDQIAISLLAYIEKMASDEMSLFDNLSIISFDYSRLAKMANLTSVAHPKKLMGKEAAKMILDMIKNPSTTNKHYQLHTELRIGESTRRP